MTTQHHVGDMFWRVRGNLRGRRTANLPKIMYYVGVIFILAGALVTIPSFIAFFIDNDPALALVFIMPALVAFLVGGVTVYYLDAPDDINIGTAMIIASLAWLIIPLIGAGPFALSGALPVQHAFFEAMSGFTTTGLTMFEDVESLPYSLLFWRSLMQWVGGVGVMVLFLSILIRRTGIAMRLYYAEGRTDRILPSIVGTAKNIWGVYIILTLVFTAIFALLGMPHFDSIVTSMSAFSTGGFSVNNDSIAGYAYLSTYNAILIVLMVAMFLGATSFAVLSKLVYGDFRTFYRNEEVRGMGLILAVVLIAYALAHVLTVGAEGLKGWEALFQSVSAMTTTGYSTADISGWSDLSKFSLIGLMTVGGSFGSTTSAIKLFRFIVLLYAVRWIIRRSLMPDSAIVPLKVGKTVYDPKDVMNVALYTVLYAFFVMAGSVVFMANGPSLADAMFEASTALGNCGLTVGLIGPGMPLYEEVLTIAFMWIGRLEIFPVLILLASPFRRH